jgi:hypothetical protein
MQIDGVHRVPRAWRTAGPTDLGDPFVNDTLQESIYLPKYMMNM